MDSAFNFKKNNCTKSSRDKLESFLYSKGCKTNKFFTNESGFYFDCNSQDDFNKFKIETGNKFLDSVNDRVLREYRNNIKNKKSDYLYESYCLIIQRLKNYQLDIKDGSFRFFGNISVLRLWNASILGAIIIGMISMSFVYRYLGAGVSATEEIPSNKEVAGLYIEEENSNDWTKEREAAYLMEMSKYLQEEADKDFDARAMELVKGYPIEKMMPYVLKKDRQVASFYIAIAKKESNWGKRVPVLEGKDCFNYLGYRGQREKMGSGGHTCFDSPKDAVDTISRRLTDLIEKYDRDTPAEMVVWKCGSSCAATGGQAAANKWISDVDMYLGKLADSD
ncbi:MAG: hypothetical protein ACD_7C00118G0002 [uncultured bacterium]|nr:MAG: hypothetical protein ACD_7C00118G0002 [uncultured bacterium]KKP67678.1 MAG: hypothetical protein UR65_C0067G0009 [Candidatus Moranbacteria bacterium GW2011_GWE2_35_164]KKP68866.1 MAG: hypothetical protein UR66_C0003G0131 [Candidatus Moranbacteria bacterium GW2011_GWE1_35_17]KKP84561.1 MAG: hypothetical protein UR83_C0018G0008 [Candidatus Moranbacteria bacterium GW2011_GWF2_35_54]KKP84593.1 MAG: hypothetical protein UR82_C0002G0010 [Candidatus Moranbacteria bacterium GW2011_GWF1_35_5]HB